MFGLISPCWFKNDVIELVYPILVCIHKKNPSHPKVFSTSNQEKIESRWHFWLPWDVMGKLNTLRCPLSIRMVALDAYPSLELGKTSWSAADASELARWICAKVGGFLWLIVVGCIPESIGCKEQVKPTEKLFQT